MGCVGLIAFLASLPSNYLTVHLAHERLHLESYLGRGPGRYLCWALTPCKLLAICVLVTYLYLGQPVFPLPA